MASPSKKTVKSKNGVAQTGAKPRNAVPLSVSSPSLLKRGSDVQFRDLINGLLTLTVRIEMLRDHLADRLGVSGPHYSLLITVGRLGGHDGISVGKVAQALRVTSAFVATESNKLAKAGLIEKRPDELDRRSVLIFLTPKALDRLAKLGPEIQNVNDKTFGSLSQAEFDQLTRLVGRLSGSASAALHELAAPELQNEGLLTLIG